MRTEIETAIKNLYQIVVILDGDSHICRFIDRNREFEHLAESTSYDEFYDSLYRNIHPADREDFSAIADPELLAEKLKDHICISCACRIRQMNGGYFWSGITYCHADQEGTTRGTTYVLLVQDIHESRIREELEELEQRMALRDLQDKYEKLFEENMRDEQTGCYNRKGLKYYTDMILDQARRTGNHLFVCVADLNGLKHLNDTYGHAAGDVAIGAVSSELLKAAPHGSRIVRIGGDEFLLMADLEAGSREPEEMGPLLDAGIAAYNDRMRLPYQVGVSYGWVFLPMKPEMTDIDEYVEMADARMYAMRMERDAYRRDS